VEDAEAEGVVAVGETRESGGLEERDVSIEIRLFLGRHRLLVVQIRIVAITRRRGRKCRIRWRRDCMTR
jgi:hypothetical protein